MFLLYKQTHTHTNKHTHTHTHTQTHTHTHTHTHTQTHTTSLPPCSTQAQQGCKPNPIDTKTESMQAVATTATGSEPRRADLVLQHAKLLTLERSTLQKLCGAEGVSTGGSKRELADRLCPVVPNSAFSSSGEVVLVPLPTLCSPHAFLLHTNARSTTAARALSLVHLPIQPTTKNQERDAT